MQATPDKLMQDLRTGERIGKIRARAQESAAGVGLLAGVLLARK